jgi:tRNA G26 N,N-dimethylase Trm1
MGMTREEAYKTIKENLCAMCAYGSQCMESCDIRGCDNRDAIKALEQEPRKGHWIDTDEWRETVDGFEQWGYFRKCSKCGYVFKFLEIDNYCPNCGAKMESEVDNGND